MFAEIDIMFAGPLSCLNTFCRSCPLHLQFTRAVTALSQRLMVINDSKFKITLQL